MPVRSAGILLYRRTPTGLQVLIGHMGGPFWARKDEQAWSLPKGEYSDGEDPLAVAIREFAEETGSAVPTQQLTALGEVRQPSGKRLLVWTGEGALETATATSNTFEVEWPRGSGRIQVFPEIDRLEWVDLDTARRRLVRGQVAFLDRLSELVARTPG